MRREEKNQQTKRRIMDSALKRFTEQGYGGSSVNHICEGEGFPKEIIFHYFQTEDELYLACVGECFRTLTGFLQEALILDSEPVHQQLQVYSNVRFDFFQAFPMYQRIFYESVIMPPRHLEAAVRRQKAEFNTLNLSMLERILAPLRLRPGISREKVADLLVQFQDYVNVRYQNMREQDTDSKTHEEDCRGVSDVLFYGVMEREEVAQ